MMHFGKKESVGGNEDFVRSTGDLGLQLCLRDFERKPLLLLLLLGKEKKIKEKKFPVIFLLLGGERG